MLNFKYRIYPTKSQQTILNNTLEECRWLYNHFIEERKNAWEKEKKNISCFDQCNTLKKLKEKRPSIKNIHSQVLQNIATRVDLAYKAFFKRVKKEEKPGYPRFKGYGRYNSFTYPQGSFKNTLGSFYIENKNIHLSKIGLIKIKLHRKPEGKIKTCTIFRSSTKKWYAFFACEIEPKILPRNRFKVGIDMGLKTFATLSDNTKIENPRFFKKEEKNLSKIQSKFSKAKKGTIQSNRLKNIFCKINERITNKRNNFSHQESRKIINNYGVICVEDLSINKMQKNGFKNINKSIADVAWDQFIHNLSYKAEYAGRTLIKVNPAYTSQTCSSCGQRHKLELSERQFVCPICGFVDDRDHNASLNILALGLQSMVEKPKNPSLVGE